MAYFSATGSTARAAKILAQAVGADIYEIRPEIPYESKDLNWMNPLARSTKEMKLKAPHPALADKDAKIDQYDEILICYPVWWYVAPTIINSFLEAYDFTGKRITLFATSGGSGLGKSADKLKKSVADGVEIRDGFMLNGVSTADGIKNKLQEIGL